MELEGLGTAEGVGGGLEATGMDPAVGGGVYLRPGAGLGGLGEDPSVGGGLERGEHESPFGVPDETRVREVLIGDTNEDRKDPKGTWIMVFRKPNGAGGEWQTHREWISVTI